MVGCTMIGPVTNQLSTRYFCVRAVDIKSTMSCICALRARAAG